MEKAVEKEGRREEGRAGEREGREGEGREEVRDEVDVWRGSRQKGGREGMKERGRGGREGEREGGREGREGGREGGHEREREGREGGREGGREKTQQALLTPAPPPPASLGLAEQLSRDDHASLPAHCPSRPPPDRGCSLGGGGGEQRHTGSDTQAHTHAPHLVLPHPLTTPSIATPPHPATPSTATPPHHT